MDSSNRAVRTVVLLLRIALGAVFVYAAWVKLREPWELFALAVNSYQILPLKMVEYVARTLPWFELAIGVMLIVGKGLRIAAVANSVLLLVFFALIVRAYAKGMEISCGCFANNEPITWLTMLRDGSMLAGSLLLTALAFRSRRKMA
jgi:uncharacterized membrane protein YphA (DoxX/SURF4 family)